MSKAAGFFSVSDLLQKNPEAKRPPSASLDPSQPKVEQLTMSSMLGRSHNSYCVMTIMMQRCCDMEYTLSCLIFEGDLMVQGSDRARQKAPARLP